MELDRLFNPAFGGGGVTSVFPVTLALLAMVAFLLVFLSRKKTISIFIATAIFIPMSQTIAIGGLDFSALRILILLCWIRLVVRGEIHSIGLNLIDKALILFVAAMGVSYILLWQTVGAFVNRMGTTFEILGVYFCLRHLIRDSDDIKMIIKTLILVSVVISVSMLIENVTAHNPFSVLGGREFPEIREGKLRCQGPFGHPILAGAFAATQIPLFMAFWHQEGRGKIFAIFGCIATMIIVLNTNSSTPIIGLLAGICAFYMYRFRNYMRVIRWGILFLLFALHMVMKAPVWALISRVKFIGSSSYFHRYQLVDQFIMRFDEWWLYGTRYTDHWGYFTHDVANWYVRIGVDGGIITLALFISVIAFSFRGVGVSYRRMESKSGEQICIWALGASLFAHSVSFFGGGYWDQTSLVWYLLLAMISMTSTINTDLKNTETDENELMNRS